MKKIKVRKQWIGVCQGKQNGLRFVFHLVKIRDSRFYRVFPVQRDLRFIQLHPSEYLDRYETVQQYRPTELERMEHPLNKGLV